MLNRLFFLVSDSGYWRPDAGSVACRNKVKRMKRTILLTSLLATMAMISCGDSATKADTGDDKSFRLNSDTSKNQSADNNPVPADPNNTSASSGPAAVSAKDPSNEILANIDKHLVAKTSFDPIEPGKEGIVNGTVTLENRLEGISFQKAYVEVSIRLADGVEYRTDYYILQNIGPGESKLVRIPKTTRGNTIVCQVVKVKSEQLTNGELKLTGSRATIN